MRLRSRSTPAVISGKVIPSSIDWGRISSPAMPHLATVSIQEPASAGIDRLVGRAGDSPEDVVEEEPDAADGELDRDVAVQGLPEPLRPAG